MVTAGAVGLSLVGGGVAVALGRGGSERYRTVTAEPGTVAQTVSVVGTVTSATRRDAAFATSGTVASVDVAVGDTVTAGQVLATLDPTDLQAALDEARSALADAQQQLEDDLETQSSGTSTVSATSVAATSATTGVVTVAATVPLTTTGTATGTASAAASVSGSGASSAVVRTVASGTATAGPSSTGSSSTGSSSTGSSDAASAAAVATAAAEVEAAQSALLEAYDQLAAAVTAQTDSWTGDTCTAFLAIDPATVVADGSDDGGDGASGDGTGDGSGDGSDDEGGDDASGGDVPDAGASTAAQQVTTSTGVPVSQVQQLLVACQEALSASAGALTEPLAALTAATTGLDDAVDALLAAVDPGDGDGTDDGGPSGGQDGGQQPGDQQGGDQDGTGQGGTGQGVGSSGSGPSGQSGSDGSSGGSGAGAADGSSGGSGGSSSRTITAATILADQAQIALREADVAVAEHELTLVDLTAPVAGTVGAVSLTVDGTVEASSTSAVVTILGGDGHVVTATVPLTSIDVVEVGQSAAVRVATSDADLTGTVSSVGVLDVSETSTPAYTVVVALDASDAAVFDDSSAQVDVAVAAGDEVLTVPTSAVRTTAGETTVQVLGDDGTVGDVTVETGAVGAELTEITSGLEQGDVVVLADLQAALDLGDDDTGTSTGLSGLSSDSSTQQGPGGQMGGPPSGDFAPRG